MTREGYKIAENLVKNIERYEECLKRIEEMRKKSSFYICVENYVNKQSVQIPPGVRAQVFKIIEKAYRDGISAFEKELENL